MEMSASISKLATALAKAQGAIDNADKGATNPHFRSKYADLAAVREAIRQPLSKAGLAYVQLPRYNSGIVEIDTMLMHGESGEFIRGTLAIPVAQNTAQAIGSAITYGRRYALMAMVGIAPEDDDANDAVGSRATSPPRGGYRKPSPPPADPRPVNDEIPHEHPTEDPPRDDRAAPPASPSEQPVPQGPTAATLNRGASRQRQSDDIFATNSAEIRDRLLAHIKRLLPGSDDFKSACEAFRQTRNVAWRQLTKADQQAVAEAEQLKVEAHRLMREQAQTGEDKEDAEAA